MGLSRYKRTKLTEKVRLKGEHKIKTTSTSVNDWVNANEAIGLLYPSIIPKLEDAYDVINSIDIDRGTTKYGVVKYYAPSIMLYILSKNREKFLKDKEYFNRDELFIHKKKGTKIVKITPFVFNNISNYKGLTDFEITNDKIKIEETKPYETYRMMYGVFLFETFLKKSFLELHDLKPVHFELIMYFNVLRFFTKDEMFAFQTLDFTKSVEKMLHEMIYLGLIELYKKHPLKESKDIYRPTDKALALAKEYVDYITFRKRMPMTKEAPVEHMQIKVLRADISKQNAKYFRIYTFYSYMFEYVNMIELKNPLGINEKEIDMLLESRSRDVYYSPFMFLQTYVLFLTGRMKPNSVRYVKDFLTKDIFGDTGYKYKYIPRLKKKEFVETLKNFSDADDEAFEMLDEFFELMKIDAKGKGDTDYLETIEKEKKLYKKMMKLKRKNDPDHGNEEDQLFVN